MGIRALTEEEQQNLDCGDGITALKIAGGQCAYTKLTVQEATELVNARPRPYDTMVQIGEAYVPANKVVGVHLKEDATGWLIRLDTILDAETKTEPTTQQLELLNQIREENHRRWN